MVIENDTITVTNQTVDIEMVEEENGDDDGGDEETEENGADGGDDDGGDDDGGDGGGPVLPIKKSFLHFYSSKYRRTQNPNYLK